MSTPLLTFDDMVHFCRAMYEVSWRYDEGADLIFAYLSAPHKWDAEYQKWREFGGTLDKECLDKLENWIDTKDLPVEDEDDE